MALDRLTIHHAKGPFASELKQKLEAWSTRVANRVNQSVGPAITSASAVVFSHVAHHVTGTAQIDTISVPNGFEGELRLIPDGAFTLGTSGNIAIASTATVGKMMILHYDPATSKWYPSY